MEFQELKAIGIVAGLFFSAIGLLLNAWIQFKAGKIRKLQIYQEIIKSHREIWKITLDSPTEYSRIFEISPELGVNPLTYAEKRFVHLILLHMTSVFNFSKNGEILNIEKLKYDIDDFLSYRIPSLVWEDTKHFFNRDFISFVDLKDNKAEDIDVRFYRKKWNVLLLSNRSEKILKTLEKYGDEVFMLKEKEELDVFYLHENKIDLIICFGYGKLLKENLLRKCLAINIHGGILPINRGPNPNLWAWVNDFPKGVSVHYIDESVDSGDIIAMKEIIYDNTHDVTLLSSFEDTRSVGEELFDDVWPLFRVGEANRISQNDNKSNTFTFADQEIISDLLDSEWTERPIAELVTKVKIIINSDQNS